MLWTRTISLTLLSSWMITASAADTDLLAKILHWQPDPQSICQGNFTKPPEIARISKPPAMSDATTTISAKRGVSFSQTGTSILHGPVVIHQPGRELKANKVTLLRDRRSKKITKIELQGDVSFEEYNRQITGQWALADLANNTLATRHSAYTMDHPSPQELLHAWGQADQARKDGCGNIFLTNTSYSVCPITNPTWQIRASNITVDKKAGVATAHHARFYIHGVPVLYLPWMNYPIKRERKSGFLLPNLHIKESDGVSIDIPYYFNLAPNYDAILSVNPMTKRGVKINGEYRYLTSKSNGQLNLSFIPRDREFRSFQRTANQDYGNRPEYHPYLSRINNASDDRFGGFFQDSTTINCHWGGSVQMAYVSDDYYLRDFGNDPITNNQNQLLNQAELHYADQHWQMFGRVQAYQTLHPITSMNPELYSRLPQIVAYGYYPHQWLGLDYELNLDYSNFDHRNDFITNTPVVSGHRFHLLPGIGAHWHKPWGYFNPMLRLDTTGYWLRNQPNTTDNNINRVLPIASIDSGLIFERFGQRYRQTLEPRLFYLWIPKKNQDDIPIFDTTLPHFSFEQVFFYNRFAGLDRFGDANRIAFALSSHWYEKQTGIERFIANIGVLYQFQKRSVFLHPGVNDDPTLNHKISPLLLSATYRFSPTIYAQGDLAWSPKDCRTETGYLRLHYQPLANQIVHVGYDFVRDGDVIMDDENRNLSRFDFGLSWPLTRQWQILANWNYNLSHNHLQHYIAGLSYDSCCYAVRVIASRTILSTSFEDNGRSNNSYYLEIKLKGLGTLGNASPSELLNNSIVGYRDVFR